MSQRLLDILEDASGLTHDLALRSTENPKFEAYRELLKIDLENPDEGRYNGYLLTTINP